MDSFSLWHWLILLIFLGTVVFGLWMMARVAAKAGYSGWWALLTMLPLLNFVMVWVFAFADWPALRERAWSAGPRQ